MQDIEAFGATSLYDAAEVTARRIADNGATHRAIVILTDGIDTSSVLTAAEVSGLASAIDVPVFVVAAVPPIDRRMAPTEEARPSWSSREADLRDLAEWTGGGLRVVSDLEEALIEAAALMDELRYQYVIGIEASGASGWRRLAVRMTDASLSVRARSGYFGSGSLQPQAAR